MEKILLKIVTVQPTSFVKLHYVLIVIDATVTQNSKNQNYVNSGVPVFLKRNTAGKISVVCDDRDIFSAFLFYLPKKGKRYVCYD